MRNIFKKGFTLAEIMIVLTVVGVITAILLPTAFHSTPDENIMKFKKANSTLFKAVHDLISTGKYYKEGDLRYQANGTTAVGNSYMCKVLSDILSVKSASCGNNAQQTTVYHVPYSLTCTSSDCDGNDDAAKCCTLAKTKERVDALCNAVTANKGFTTTDDVFWFEAGQKTTLVDPECSDKVDCNNAYKVFCIDVDGRSGSEEPFGYGIRSDGKIITGKRADTWINLSVQNSD